MRRIATTTAVVGLPTHAAGAAQGYFVDPTTTPTGTPTDISPEWCNNVQESIVQTIEGAGETPADNSGQLAAVLKGAHGIKSHATDTGSVTTPNKRVVIASTGGQASNAGSAVIASGTSVASGAISAVIAGSSCTASGAASAVIGALSGAASGQGSLVGGGTGGVASAANTASIGGSVAQATAARAVALGGANNTASQTDAATVGGTSLTASGADSFAAGGNTNQATGSRAAAVAGASNLASGLRSAIVGGTSHIASSDDSGCFAGADNEASTAARSACVGGTTHVATGLNAVCVGGNAGDATNTDAGVFGGAGGNATGTQSAAVGGSNLLASNTRAVSVGGSSNDATAQDAACIGGSSNEATTARAICAGGSNNAASGDGSGCFAGDANVASGLRSTCLGGYDNTASGADSGTMGCYDVLVVSSKSVLLGSKSCELNDQYCTAGGYDAGTLVPSGSDQFLTWKLNAETGDISCDGTVTDTGADFAEMFENAEVGVIPKGALVTRVGRKVRLAKPGDKVFGAVSAAPAFLAASGGLSWAGKYARDEWGQTVAVEVPMVRWDAVYEDREIAGKVRERVDGEAVVETTSVHTESVMVRSGYDGRLDLAPLPIPADAVRSVANPRMVSKDYDPTRKNVPRPARPAEWTAVALIGQVRIRVAKTVKVDDELVPGPDGCAIAGACNGVSVEVMEITTPWDKAKGYGVALCIVR